MKTRSTTLNNVSPSFLTQLGRKGLWAALLLLGLGIAYAQNPPPVTDEASWQAAIAQANSNGSTPTTITISNDLLLTTSVLVNANVTILGNGYSIDMQSFDRALFIAGGTVAISNLKIQNGNATGGDGGYGGGAGAGLGGAIFVGSGSYASGDGSAATLGLSAPNVTLTNVSFHENSTVAGHTVAGDTAGGGGGGLGGAGGLALRNNDVAGGAGGGGIASHAQPAYGADGDFDGTAGAFDLVGNSTPAGDGGNGYVTDGGSGGSSGGGGGGGGAGSFGALSNNPAGSGGGGGVNGGRGYYQNDNWPNGGGDGGFGGGGGGSTAYYGGNGGFGGGGGGGITAGGNGGFGGGGGNGDTPGLGGFGASSGSTDHTGAGGGGLAAGGAVFVMDGASLTINVTGSTTYGNNGAYASYGGSAYGNDLFLGGDVSLNVSAGQQLSLDSLGGAGNTADPNVSGAPTEQIQQAQGGLTLTGGGQLTLTGSSFYAGATVLNSGTLALAQSTLEQGTSSVTVGQNNGDNATLVLNGNSTLNVGTNNSGTVTIAQGNGATGTVVIGSGSGSSGAYVGASVFTGGDGVATLKFEENFATGSTSNTAYQFFTVLQGTLQIFQNGPGTTVLNPQSGANTFSGRITVNDGVLQLGSGSAMPQNNNLTINGGAFDINGFNVPQAGNVTLNGGSLINSSTTTNAVLTVSPGSQLEINGTAGIQTGLYVNDQGSASSSVNFQQGNLTVAGRASDTTATAYLNADHGFTVGTQGDATLQLVNAGIASNGENLILGSSGNTGTLTIGNGAGSSGAWIGMPAITTSSGTGIINFNQQYAAGSTANTNYSFNSAIQGAITVNQNGPGATTLTQHNSYTGGTYINSGTLVATTTAAFGSGTVHINRGVALVTGGSAISNVVIITGDGSYNVDVESNGSLANMANATSDFNNGRSTSAALLDGTSSTETTLVTGFSTASITSNDGIRQSDIYTLQGIQNQDIFVVELSMTSIAPGSILGWRDTTTNAWVNAVEGSSFAGEGTFILGAYNPSTDNVLGYYGYDAATNSVWAVVNQTGDFAIIPEPSTWGLLAAGVLLGLRQVRRGRMERKVG